MLPKFLNLLLKRGSDMLQVKRWTQNYLTGKLECRKYFKIYFTFSVKIHYIRRPQMFKKYNSNAKLWAKEECHEKYSTLMTPSY
jgi:hypothetical protein